MSLWAFRFLLWYIAILFVQPQNRFTFLYSFHIADIAVITSLGLHFMACMQEKRPFIRLGPATIAALLLLMAGFTSQYVGIYQISPAWNGYIEQLAKGALVLIMVEAMADTVERVWAVLATMMICSLWWIKAGLRLAATGATYSLDRIMGPAVSIVADPNGFAYMLCVMIPLYLYFYQQSEQKFLRWSFLGIALAAVYIAMETGSRTGLMILLFLGVLLFFKYGREHKTTLFVGGVAVFLIIGLVRPGNIERFKTIPGSFRAFISGEGKHMERLSQSEQSAQERRAKNKDTWALIKEYPVFGVGINADQSRYVARFPSAGGQVHCEILMAGRQMGIVGMSLYVAMLGALWGRGRKSQKQTASSWPGVSDIGWTLKTQAVTILVGGFFSPLPWNAVTLILAGTASSLWLCVRGVEAEAPAPSGVVASSLPAQT